MARTASACLYPLAKRAARAYIAGDQLSDAVRVERRLAQTDINATLGYWDGQADTPRGVADQYLAGIDALAQQAADGYLSIKLPALKFDEGLIDEVVGHARQRAVRLHCDALAPQDADPTRAAIERALQSGVAMGYTLPGRWLRSLDDARWAAGQRLTVRVVKGQWLDPAAPDRDLRSGFLEVIDLLAGSACHVNVASHDAPLAIEGLRRLQAAGTSCGLELLYGLPMRGPVRLARSMGVSIRVYVPYGAAYLPYTLSRVGGNPRVAWWLLKDLLANPFGRKSS